MNQQDVDGLFRSYLALSAELARDDVSNASERLSAVREAAKKIAASGDSVTARRAGRVAAAVPDRVGAIADLREGFKSLSAAVTELLASARPGPSVTPTIRRVRCPMAKASWLQTGEAVTNPYYGSEMLRCGSIEETFDLRGER